MLHIDSESIVKLKKDTADFMAVSLRKGNTPWVRRLALFLFAAHAAFGQSPRAREILRQLIEINTSVSTGATTPAVEAITSRFRAAGIPEADIHIFNPVARKSNLVVRLRGIGAERPILFIGHLDVVEAQRADWSFDPFVFREQNGYFYGRGTQDMKDDDAIFIANFLRLKEEGFRPSRDFILALTSDEEAGLDDGIDWLLRNHRDLIDACGPQKLRPRFSAQCNIVTS